MEGLPKLKPDQNRKYSSLCLSRDLQNPLRSCKLNKGMSGSGFFLFDCCVV